MPELCPPSGAVRPSYVAALREFHAEGRHLDADATALADAGAFEDLVDALHDAELAAATSAPGGVPTTTFWYCDGARYLGRITLRHRLTDALRDVGGHVGYEVRPSARRRGHAGAMLRGVLPAAAALGLERVLLTCDAGNLPSRRVIEGCGGVLTCESGGVRRYRVPTAR
ncbi:GNAT family N-acetyltransferase [Kineococcus glutinatus]|uniref:GNAT family N-acetyltransferase n=1 Tax=Kineococcus glutinatus TaxID=1070872 RepID=A0ABP9HXX4_9ACTN